MKLSALVQCSAAAVLLILLCSASAPAAVCHALEFDGVDDCALVPGNDIFEVQQHTVEAWVRIHSHPYEQVIVGSCASGSRWDTFSLWLRGQRLCSSISDGVSNIELLGTGDALPLDEVLHLAATYDGEYLRTYVNGVRRDSLSWTGILGASSADPVTIGIDRDVQEGLHDPFFGWIGEVRIWSRALSPTELGGPSPAGSELVGWWVFEEDPGDQTIYDDSGHSQDGYLGEFSTADSRDPERVECTTPVDVRSWGSIKALCR